MKELTGINAPEPVEVYLAPFEAARIPQSWSAVGSHYSEGAGCTVRVWAVYQGRRIELIETSHTHFNHPEGRQEGEVFEGIPFARKDPSVLGVLVWVVTSSAERLRLYHREITGEYRDYWWKDVHLGWSG